MLVVKIILLILAGLGIGILIGFWARKRIVENQFDSIRDYSKKIINEAHQKAKTIKKEAALKAKDTFYQMRLEFEKETEEKREQLQSLEKRLFNKEENLDRKIEQYEQKEKELFRREKEIEKAEANLRSKQAEYDELLAKERRELERVAGISREEAKSILIRSMESEARHSAAKVLRKIENETKEQAQRKAQEILALAVKRYAGDYVAEKTVSVVSLPNEEMKGRIIGREGRNIRAIEAATGIDVIIDDTPEAVILSGFNPVRREVAKIALERLIDDGRIHPARIEEMVERVNREIEASIKEAGEQATFDLGVHGIDPELVKLIGRLKYRSSYAQNVLQHSREVGFICGMMAAELGLNVKKAKRAGLLHDIGKAVDHEMEGPHALIGAELAKKYGESADVVHAIAAHHEEVQPETTLAVLVQAADTLSGARPGARQEMLESYVKRLEDLEKIAMSFEGVTKSYAIQAGREIRIMVEEKSVDDDHAFLLCKDIAKKIEKELSYPGQIKVTVIRELRAVDYAK
ncbi:MAG: ribonuclease Y [Deltaproteobacteria bacterium]|nr:ribonuclease Y [Deltaproteobacteria bacterium]MBW1918771.1 ribonuclease Y [Deltaproteobacteria bacterium]RLB34828.1 MAG: ribonuclease Y [Deltaproteobacteria bacterium]